MKLKSVLMAASLAAATLCCHAATTLTLAHIYPAEHPTARAVAHFADSVKARSQGRVLIKVFADASMGNQTPILQSLRNGSLDLSILSQGVLSPVVPEANALGMPFLFSDQANAWRVLNGVPGQQLAQKMAAAGLMVLSFWEVEIRQLSNSVRPLLKPADVAGLRFRTPPDPLTVDIIRALGGKAQEVNFSDLHKALQQGVVDGQDTTLASFHALKLYQVQKFISLTGHKTSVFTFLMAKSAWDGLPSADRELVKEAAKEAARYYRTLADNAESDAYRDLVARGVRIDKVDTRPFAAATAKIYEKWYASPIGDYVRTVVNAAREGR